MLLELLKAAGDARAPSQSELAQLTGYNERTVRTSIRELETLQVGEYLRGSGRAPGRFVFDPDALGALTGGAVVRIERPHNGPPPRGRASSSSSSAASSPSSAAAGPAAGLSAAEEELLRRLRNGMRRDHGVKLPPSTWAAVADYLRRIEARGQRPAGELHRAGAEAAKYGAESWAYVRSVLDDWGYGPHADEIDFANSREDVPVAPAAERTTSDDGVIDFAGARARRDWWASS